MNCSGVLMAELGLQELMGWLVRSVEPWARRQFPSLVHPATGLDSFRAFTVTYTADTKTTDWDTYLGMHTVSGKKRLNKNF
jgi:hypothetical protein